MLYLIAANAVLRETALRLTFPLYRIYFNEKSGAERAQKSLVEHEGIIAAILSGDGVRAERLMRAHLRNGAEAVCVALDQFGVASGAEDAIEGNAA